MSSHLMMTKWLVEFFNMSADDELRAYYQEQLAEERREQSNNVFYRLVEFVSRSAGKGRKRREREVRLINDGTQTLFVQTKSGLQPVGSRARVVIIDDLLNQTETTSVEDALDKLRGQR